jgi:antitoxin-like ribbon-helix-helix protein
MANRFQGGLRKLKEEAGSAPPSPASAVDSAERDRVKTPVPPTREGKKVISGYFEPAVKRQFAQIALNEDLSHQQVLAEALNLLFQSRGLPQIAK